jgi:hypothetical protein
MIGANARNGFFVSAVLLAGLLAVAFATRVASRHPSFRVEWAEQGRLTLEPALEQKLRNLRDDVFVTYYATTGTRMPAHMKRVEAEVVGLLDAMRAAAGGRFDWRLVDPTGDEDLARFAARRKVAPVRVRNVRHDRYTESEVYSTLSVAYGPRPPALIEAIGEAHLPRLQTILHSQLEQLASPRRPVIALAAPREGYAGLREFLRERAEVIGFDAATGSLPWHADLVIVVDPGAADGARAVELRRFLAAGGSAIVAGAPRRASCEPPFDALELEPPDSSFAEWIAEFGVRSDDALLVDLKSARLPLPNGDPGSPFRVASLVLDQDFQTLARDSRGTLLFVAPAPLRLDAARLEDLGLRADVLATSSDESGLLLAPLATRYAATNLGPAVAAPKQPLLVRLVPHERFQGSLVVAASPSLLHDEFFAVETLANRRALETLLDTLASDERLVMRRAGVLATKPLAMPDAASRTRWRALVIGLPVLLLGIAFVMHGRGRRSGRRGATRFAVVRILAPVLLVLLVLFVVGGATRLTGLAGARSDWTRDRVHELAPRAALAAREAKEETVARLLFSPDRELPPEYLPRRAILRERLAAFAAAGARLVVRAEDPADLDAAEHRKLGIAQHRAASRLVEATTVRRFHAALVLERGERSEVLEFGDAEAFEDLDFRLAHALHRLGGAPRARIAFASDVPRLSPGEAFEHFQQKGLVPPSGKDVYALARAALAKRDFEVVHVNPREPAALEGFDALFWLQPRRSIEPMLEQVVAYLHRGGKVFLAAQHFVIQPRQYRGRDEGLEHVFWPQPQMPDVETWYFPDLGLDLVREVVFDRNDLKVDLATRIHRSGRREFESQEAARPFCIRALAANFAAGVPLLAGVTDLPFLFGAWIEVDRARLAAAGLTARPLVFSSEETWTFAWTNGWLPKGVLAGPGATPSGEKDVVPEGMTGPLPLAVEVTGAFPWPQHAFERPPIEIGPDGVAKAPPPKKPYPHDEPAGASAPGRLVYFGTSECFKDEWLIALRPEMRADHLLVQAAASLALGDEWVEVLSRRPARHGLPRVDGATARSSRLLVVGLPVATIALLALLHAIASSRLAARRASRFAAALRGGTQS